MKKLLIACGVLVGSFVLTSFLAAASPELGFAAGITVLVLGGLAVLRPMPWLGMGSRLMGCLVLLVGLLATVGSNNLLVEERNKALETLKTADPGAYLTRLKDIDEDRWLEELKVLKPDDYAAAAASVSARREAEAQKLAHEAEAERKAQREAACGEKNAALAYIMMQSEVTRRLKAPSTAEYPWAHEISSRPLGDCLYGVTAYVDAQNSFGAMLRTSFIGTIRHYPEEGSWQVQSLQIGD